MWVAKCTIMVLLCFSFLKVVSSPSCELEVYGSCETIAKVEKTSFSIGAVIN
jgi:hypothetical protein